MCSELYIMGFTNFLLFLYSLSLVLLLLFMLPSDSLGFGPNQHEEITQRALPFLRPAILSQIVYGNNDQDRPNHFLNPEWHFDRCTFEQGSRFIRDHYEDVFDETTSIGDFPFRAAFSFGELLHGAQDFYSHSNWAELNKSYIVQNGIDNWQAFEPFGTLNVPDNIIVLQYLSPSR